VGLGTVNTDTKGVATATYKWPLVGTYTLTATVMVNKVATTNSLTVLVAPPNFVEMTLAPARRKYHVYEPITLTAKVLNTTGGAAPNITVSFSLWGTCRIEPRATLRTAVSDAQGVATITFTSLDEGKIAVVAGARNNVGTPVVSLPSRLKIVDHHRGYGRTEGTDRWVCSAQFG
jgi:hypothetical protein